MERIVKSQTLGADTSHTYSMMNRRLLELNPEHSLIKKLKDGYTDEKKVSQVNDLVDIMINGALIHSGYNVLKPAEFSEKIMKIVLAGLDMDDADDADANDTTETDNNNNDNVSAVETDMQTVE